ncbi:MAG: hypothetical protein ACKN82_09495 [Pirellula sp.]
MVTTRFDNSLVKKVRSARTFCLLVVVSMSMGLQAQEAKEIVIEQAAAGKAAAGIIADVQIVVAPAVAAPAAVKDDPKQAAKPKSDKATDKANDKVIEKIPRAFDRNRPEPEEEVEAPKKNAMVNFAMDPDRWTDVIYSQLGGSEATFEQQQRRRVRSTINRIELICTVDEKIREKVQETAELEIQRFKTEVLALATQGPRNPTQEEYSEFYNKVFKLTERFRQQNQANASRKTMPLWQKVLYSNLSDQNKEDLEKDNRKRAEYRQQVVRLEVLLRVSRRLGLTSKQREKLEPYTLSNTEAWKTLDQAWQTLQQFPDKEKRDIFTPEQIQELKKPLEHSDDLQLVIREFGDDL